MALPAHQPLLPINEYEAAFRKGTMQITDHIHTLETSGRSSRAAREALNSSLIQLNELSEYNKVWIEQNVPAEYRKGWDRAFESSLYATPTAVGGAYGDRAFGMLHREAIETLAYNMKDRTDLALAQVGRQVADQYRDVGMSEALKRQFTGETIRQSTQNMVGRLQAQGLTTFSDRAGRKWGLDAYCSMVARTTTRQATTQGTLLRARRLGYERIHISEHTPTCELCAPYQGLVFTTNSDDKEYPYYYDYVPFHPNCLHTVSVYIKRYDNNAEALRQKSNQPLRDRRPPSEKAAYKSLQAANQKSRALQNQYSNYLTRLGQDKVGTIQSFARSKAAGSARYQELQAAYRQAGIS